MPVCLVREMTLLHILKEEQFSYILLFSRILGFWLRSGFIIDVHFWIILYETSAAVQIWHHLVFVCFVSFDFCHSTVPLFPSIITASIALTHIRNRNLCMTQNSISGILEVLCFIILCQYFFSVF